MKSIFVNIFGGIARCDHIAEAVVAGVKAVGGNAAIKPLVIRLEGRGPMGWAPVRADRSRLDGTSCGFVGTLATGREWRRCRPRTRTASSRSVCLGISGGACACRRLARERLSHE